MATTSYSPEVLNLRDSLPHPMTPWLISDSLYLRLQAISNPDYKKCEVLSSDPEWTFLQVYFSAQKPTNRSIKTAYCIHNPSHTKKFEKERWF